MFVTCSFRGLRCHSYGIFLWRAPRTFPHKKLSTIVLPINVQNIHWYVAVILIDNLGVTLKVLNDIELQSRSAEESLVTVGEMYRQRMWMQKSEKDNMATPMKITVEQEISDKSTTSP